MNQTLAAWLLIGIALITANLPFLTERAFGLFAWRGRAARAASAAIPPSAQARDSIPPAKPVWFRFVEVVVGFLITGAIGMAFESALGNRFAQTWEFYAITFALYLVLGYPGFVYRYLFRRRQRGTLD